MAKSSKHSLSEALSSLTYLVNRTPEMAFSGGTEEAFAEVSRYRDGAVYVGHYSGTSEWERHSSGDEIVLVLEGSTTIILLHAAGEERVTLTRNEMVVVPSGTWHRFEDSVGVKVMTVTPQPTEHSLEQPGA